MAQLVKNPPAMKVTSFGRVPSSVGKMPWLRAWQPTPIFLPRESLWTEEPGRLQSLESQSVGHDQMVNTEIRLIIFFAAKDGEALYSKQNQDQELTVA